MNANELADHRRSLKAQMVRLLNDFETFDLDPIPFHYMGFRKGRAPMGTVGIETSAGHILYDSEEGTWKAS